MNLIKRLLKEINNISIKRKLVFSYLFVVVLPVLLVGIILTGNLRKMALESAVKEATANVDRVRKGVVDTMKAPIDISMQIYGDSYLQSIVSKKYESSLEVMKAYENYRDFDDFKRVYKEIYNIKLYTQNDTILENWSFMKASDEIKELSWYQEAVRGKGKITWRFIADPADITNTKYLSLVRMVTDAQGKIMGVLVVQIKNEYLHSILSQESFEIMMTDDVGRIIEAGDSSLVGKFITDTDLLPDWKPDSDIFESKFNGRLWKIIQSTFSYPEYSGNLRIVSIFPVNNILSSARRISVLGFFIMLISLFFAFAMIFVFSKALSNRISLISMNLHSVANGNFEVIEVDGEDEVGQLSKDLIMMVDSIKELMYKINNVNMQKNQLVLKQKEIKLKMLANQINPHFLFNTLETIRMTAHSNGQKDIASITKLLGKIMRKSLEVGSELILIEAEIDLVKCYLDIQKFRYSKRLSYDIKIIDDISNYKILPLIVQPLVENAVIHGIENKEGQGNIEICLQESDGFLVISVADNGLGINANVQKALMESFNEYDDDDSGRHIGMKNVHQRIRLYYGEKYGIRFQSTMGVGTKVDIMLPKGEYSCV